MKQNTVAKNKQCMLQRSKSNPEEEECDTMIIEESSYNKPRTSKIHPFNKNRLIHNKNQTFPNLISQTSHQKISKEVEKNKMMQTQKAKNISILTSTARTLNKHGASKKLVNAIQDDKTDDIWNELDEVINRTSNTSFIKIEKDDIEDIQAYKPNFRRNRRIHF